MKPVVFSIVTVVWNNRAALEGTMESVFSQTYPHIDYWIIDGASTDGTVEFLENHPLKNQRFHFISAPDKGIYNAMNKSFDFVSGDFICFLNAGDWLFSEKTIENLAKLATPEVDILFGETMLVDENRQPAGTMSELSTRRLPKNLTVRSMQRGMVVVHQSFYPRIAIAPNYNQQYRLCSDIDWVIRCLEKSRKTVNSEQILTNYLMGGMSKKRHRESLRERFFILKKHFGLVPTLWNHGLILLRAVVHRFSKTGKRY